MDDAALQAIRDRHAMAYEDLHSNSLDLINLQDTARDVPVLLAELEAAQARAIHLEYLCDKEAIEHIDRLQARLDKAADPVNGPVQLAIHRAVCEDALVHCVENRGRCVRSAEAVAWALGLGEEGDE